MVRRFKFRDLKTTAEFAEFAKGYMGSFHGKQLNPVQGIHAEVLSGYKRVIGVYDKDKLVAGYIVNSYPHRCFEYFNDEEKSDIIEALGGLNRVCEVAAIWKTTAISRLIFNLAIWPKITFDALKERRSIVFGCSYAGHGMLKKYSILNPTIVRQGKNTNDLTVFYFCRTKMVLTYIVAVAMIIPQELFRHLLRSRLFRRILIND